MTKMNESTNFWTIKKISSHICDALRDLVSLYNLRNVKNIRGGVIFLVQVQVKPVNLLNVTRLHQFFSRFYIVQILPNRAKRLIYIFWY